MHKDLFASPSTLRRSLAAALLSLLAAPAFCADAADAAKPTPAWTNGGNFTLVSDYVFRGVSQTQGKPTGQATLDFTHASGAYLGVFGSGVSHAAYNNGSGSEIDLYGGYRLGFGEGKNLDMGLVTYWYPGANYVIAGKKVTYHTQDLKLGLNLGAFNATAWLTASRNWFGFGVDPATGQYSDSRGTFYYEGNWNPEIASGLVLNLHAGHQTVHHFEKFNFLDLRIGLSKTWDTWALTGGVSHNSGDATRDNLPYWTFFNADGSSKNVVGTRVQLTIGRNF